MAASPEPLPDPEAQRARIIAEANAVVEQTLGRLKAIIGDRARFLAMLNESVVAIDAEATASDDADDHILADVSIPLLKQLAQAKDFAALPRVAPMIPGPRKSPKGFTPTPEQHRFANAVVANPSLHTVAEICLLAGIHPSSYYRWCHNPGFRQWLTAAWSEELLFSGWRHVNLARVQSATRFSYWKAVADLIFDPRGLGHLQRWQEKAAAVEETSDAPPVNPNRVADFLRLKLGCCEPDGDDGPNGATDLATIETFARSRQQTQPLTAASATKPDPTPPASATTPEPIPQPPPRHPHSSIPPEWDMFHVPPPAASATGASAPSAQQTQPLTAAGATKLEPVPTFTAEEEKTYQLFESLPQRLGRGYTTPERNEHWALHKKREKYLDHLEGKSHKPAA